MDQKRESRNTRMYKQLADFESDENTRWEKVVSLTEELSTLPMSLAWGTIQPLIN